MNISEFAQKILGLSLALILLLPGLTGCITSEGNTTEGVPTEVVNETPIDDASVVEPTSSVDGLSAHLEIPKFFSVGEKINLKFVLMNTSNSPIYILQWYTPLEGIAGEIFEVTHNGHAIPYKGILASRIAPTTADYVLLYPGEPTSAVVDLAEAYDFTEAGEYRIKFTSPRISDIARTEDEMAQTMEELGPLNIPSEEVSIEIIESTAGNGPPRLRTTSEAQEMIVAYLRHENRSVGPIIPVEELYFEDLWAELGAQLFRVRKGKILKESFLIRGPNVIQLGAALGGQGVTSLALADLDQDGQAEMYFAYSSGAENPHSRIGMYVPAYDEHRIFESSMSYLGHLRVFAEDGLGIGVQVVEGDSDTKTLKLSPKIGYLTLKRESDEMRLSIRLGPNVPDEILQKISTKP